jgi:3-oxoacyl-[acyl-carrier-protein] synthase II
MGHSGAGPITHFDSADFDVKIAAEVRGFDPTVFMDRKMARRMDRFIQFAVAASRMALEDARLTIDEANADRIGVLVGTAIGGLTTLEAEARQLVVKGPARVSPLLIPMTVPDMASGYVSVTTGARGPNTTVVSACATGANALGESLEILRRGAADAMIAGSSEAVISPLAVASLGNMRALTSRFNTCPERASRPFDGDRNGFVLGEGAGMVILETLEHAERRAAPHIYAELIGFGMSGDAYHITHPAPDGEGIARALVAALDSAGIAPEEVDYINAHAPSLRADDAQEILAIKSVFGAHAYKLRISSTKSMTGHLLGAAGSVEAIATVAALHQGIIPPTINQTQPDPLCDLDFTPNVARAAAIKVGVSINAGFGGRNAALVFRRFS